MECGQEASGARRPGSFDQRVAELDARLAFGHRNRAILFGQLDRDVAFAIGSFCRDFPIPAGLGEIAVREVSVPYALLMVTVEPIVGEAGGGFVVLANCFGQRRRAFGFGDCGRW